MKSILPIFLLLIIFMSCRNEQSKSIDSVLDIRLPKEPEKLNPIYFPNSTAREAYQYIFLPLAEYNPTTLKMEAVMIKEMPNQEIVPSGPYKGATQYTFEILDEARWDDGKPVTGEDYLFTLKAIMHPGTSAGAYRSVVSKFSDVVIDPVNKKKVTVIFANYFMLSKEATLNIELLPKHIYDPQGALDRYLFTDFLDEKKAATLIEKDSILMKFGEISNTPKFNKEIVQGNGPYKLNSWNTAQNIILEKKQNYWASNSKVSATAQNPDKIILHIIPDETAAYTRLMNKEIDVLSGLSSSNFEKLKKDSSKLYSFHSPQLMKYHNIVLNFKNPILKSGNVRKAIAAVTDVDRYIETFENKMATRVVGPINPTKDYYNNKLVPYPFDIANAISLLKNDNWKDSNKNGVVDKNINGKLVDLNLELMFSGNLGKNIALILQEDAKKAGINLILIQKDFALIRKENLESGKFDMILQTASQDVGFEDLSQRFHSSNTDPGGSNYNFYINPKADDLIDKINSIKDDDERKKLYVEIQEVFYNDLPYIFLYAPKERIVITNRWKGTTNSKRPGYQANTFSSQFVNSMVN